MKKKTYKIIICVSLIVMLFTSFTSVFGATNDYYTGFSNVSENALDSKIKSSVLLDALANMVNALGSLIEYLTGSIFYALTGDNIFPWADRIIFNGIGFLDINFLNPADNSLFMSEGSISILGKVVKNVYSTIFSLSVLFLGVAVGIMAIRLAISSIAAEKAKYKQAIVNWATCLVMLFLMHYILAFVFWVNEQLVSVASGIFIKAIQDNNLTTTNFEDALSAVIDSQTRVDNYISSVEGGNEVYKNIIKEDVDITAQFLGDENYVEERMTYVKDSGKDGWQEFWSNVGFEGRMADSIGLPRLAWDVKDAIAIKNLVASDSNAASEANSRGYYNVNNHNIYVSEKAYYDSDDYILDMSYAIAIVCSNITANDKVYTYYSSDFSIKPNDPQSPNLWGVVGGYLIFPGANIGEGLLSFTFGSPSNIKNCLNTLKGSIGIDALREMEKNGDSRFKTYMNAFKKGRLSTDKKVIAIGTGANSISSGSVQDIIANLGNFFKKSAYVYTSKTVETNDEGEDEVITGWRASKVSVTGALLYAIFVFQSLVYLIMYVKRLFYVIMLSMFGPVVVIYDFFMKSAS